MSLNALKERYFLVGIIAVHIFFFALALHFGKIYNGDSFEYVYEALNIKNHFLFYCGHPLFPVTDEFKTLRTPGYPLFMSLIYFIKINNYLVLAFQNLVSIFNILYLRKLLLDLGYEIKNDKWLLLFILLFPVQFVYANIIAPDILLQSFVLVYFRHAIQFLRTREWKNALWMSIALVIGLLVKPVLYPFAAVHFIIVLLFSAKKIRLKAFLAAALPIVCILLYNGWNASRTGKFHFTSTQSFNAIYYYSKYFDSKKDQITGPEFLRQERSKIATMKDFSSRYDYANDRGKELLKKEFVPYMLFHTKNSIRFFFDPGKGELDMFTGKLSLANLYTQQTKGMKEYWKEESFKGVYKYIIQQPMSLLAILVAIFCLVKMTGLGLFLFSKNYSIQVRGFVFVFLAYFALITGPISSAHYVLPVSLIISGLAVIGISRFLQRRQNKIIITSSS